MEKICAVVVTYEPSFVRLAELLTSLWPQVDGLVIVDNASSQAPSETMLPQLKCFKRCHIVALAVNVGLAAGQNEGCYWARTNGFSHVLLLDQDSVPGPSMVRRLLDKEQQLLSQGVSVAVVAPQCRDDRNDSILPFFKIGYCRVTKLFCPGDCADERNCYPDFVISSGSLIRLSVLGEVGLFDEALFIDSVDVEWCYRAANEGYQSVGVFAAVLNHRIGDQVVIFFGGKLVIYQHSPQRLRYMMRNRIWLYRKRYIPLRWKLNDIPRMLAKFLIFTLVIWPRGKNCRAMLQGFRQGCGVRR